MISLGGQAPRVLRAHMWALNTCGEPNELELPTAHGLCYRSFSGYAAPGGDDVPPAGQHLRHGLVRARRRGHARVGTVSTAARVHPRQDGHHAQASKERGSMFRVGVSLVFVRRSGTTRAEGPHGAHVRGAKRNRVDRRSRMVLPLFFSAFSLPWVLGGLQGSGPGKGLPDNDHIVRGLREAVVSLAARSVEARRFVHLRKCLLPHPATPYYPSPRGKFHTRGNIWSFAVGRHECCDPAGVAGALCPLCSTRPATPLLNRAWVMSLVSLIPPTHRHVRGMGRARACVQTSRHGVGQAAAH